MDLDSRVSRFLTSRSHFSANESRVKHGAFLPPASLELSVFVTDQMSLGEIWDCADTHIPRKVYGRADISRVGVEEGTRLSVVVDNTPRNHANIVGWPQDKPARKRLAIKLANLATLELRAIEF